MPHTKIDRLLAIVYEIYMHKIYTLVIHTIFGFFYTMRKVIHIHTLIYKCEYIEYI